MGSLLQHVTQNLGTHLVAPPCLAGNARITAGYNFHLLGQNPNASRAVISREATGRGT